MKSTGIVRKIDELGRITIPMELRRTLGIQVKDPLEIYVDKDKIILTKYETACIFCENTKNIETYMGKNVCRDCKEKMGSECLR
ncbi:MAG TPA: AbrB family transcriptional regulator [Actinobacteria bacterium]|nr:AbrB family transcriptional regulator [Actinomycetota bacterium]